MYNEIGIKVDALNSNIKNINSSKQIIMDDWNTILNDLFPKLQNSWAGTASKSYIDATLKYKAKVEALLDSLDLLSSTLQKASDLITSTDSELANNISNMSN